MMTGKMRTLNVENASPDSPKPKSPASRYTALFRKRKKQQHAPDRQKADPTNDASDNASILPRLSDVGTVSSSRHRVRRDIQSHIPDWIDDVVHAQLIEIAERIAAERMNADENNVWSPTMAEPAERPDESPAPEPDRPGSAPEASRPKPSEDVRNLRRSSISAPSIMSFSQIPDINAIVSPIESIDTPRASPIDRASDENKPTRHSRNVSSSSGATSFSEGSETSDYSKRSSMTSPGTSADQRISDQLSAQMTWKDIATQGHPIKKPVEAGRLRGVNIHLAKAGTTYAILSPVQAGVFDETKAHASTPSSGYSVLSPTQAGVFDDISAKLNKPLPPDPIASPDPTRTTFFVVGDVVLSPQIPHSSQSASNPATPDLTQTPQSALTLSEVPSPKHAHVNQLSRPHTHVPSREQGPMEKKFARLSRPFSEPVFDFAFEDTPVSPTKVDEEAGHRHVELEEKFVVVEEEDRNVRGAVASKPEVSGRSSLMVPTSTGTALEVIAEELRSPQSPQKDDRGEAIVEGVLAVPLIAVEHVGLEEQQRAEERETGTTTAPPAGPGAQQADGDVEQKTDVDTEIKPGTTADDKSRPLQPQDQIEATEEGVLPIEEFVTTQEQTSSVEDHSGNVEEHSPGLRPTDQPTNIPAIDQRITQEASDHNEDITSDEEADDDPSDCPSPTLSQAENDLMAQLELDCSYKFLRPTSWLAYADSPTLGVMRVLPELVLRREPPHVDQMAPKDALKKKTQSHYEFVFSEEHGWYVS